MSNEVSIHAPVKGATVSTASWTVDVQPVSIHAPVKGATAAQWACDQPRLFQSTRP